MSRKVCDIVILLVYILICSNAFSNDSKTHSIVGNKDDVPWEVSGQTIYWRTTNTSFHGYDFNPGYAFGYQLTGLYHINDTRHFSAQWLQYKKFEPFDVTSDRNPFSRSNAIVTGSFLEAIDILNLSLSKSVDFRDRLEFEFYAGLQYLTMRTQEIIDFLDPVSGSTITETYDSRFYGFGPRIGFSIDYALFQQLHAYADIAFASIVVKFGKNSIDLNMIDRRYNPAIDSSYTDVNKKKGPLGGQESSLGLVYTLNRFNGKLKLIGGISGAAFDIDDTKFSGYFLGGTWVGDD